LRKVERERRKKLLYFFRFQSFYNDDMMKRKNIVSVLQSLSEKSARTKRLPPLTRAEMSKWGDPFGREMLTSASAFAQQKEKAEKKKQFVVVRHSDGKAWSGPWLNDGKRFSSVESKWYYFLREEDAEQAVEREGFDFRVDVFEM